MTQYAPMAKLIGITALTTLIGSAITFIFSLVVIQHKITLGDPFLFWTICVFNVCLVLILWYRLEKQRTYLQSELNKEGERRCNALHLSEQSHFTNAHQHLIDTIYTREYGELKKEVDTLKKQLEYLVQHGTHIEGSTSA